MPKIVDRTDKKNQILQALYQCLLEKPFFEISNKDIAKAANVNHGILYYYFENKEDILLQFIDHMIEIYQSEYTEWLAARQSEKLSGKELLRESLDFMIKRITLNKELSKIFIEIWALANYNPRIKEKLQLVYEEWNQTIMTEMVTHAELPKDLAQKLSLAAVAFSEGLAMLSIVQDNRQENISELLEELKLLLDGAQM